MLQKLGALPLSVLQAQAFVESRRALNWSAEEDEAVRANESNASVARQFGRSVHAVACRRSRLGAGDALDDGGEAEEADIAGPARWTREQEEQLLDGLRMGHSNREIAKSLGRSLRAVECKSAGLRAAGRLEMEDLGQPSLPLPARQPMANAAPMSLPELGQVSRLNESLRAGRWEEEEEKQLVARHGREPLATIAADLRRDLKAVQNKVCQMKQQGRL
jgi:hypothetical protein